MNHLSKAQIAQLQQALLQEKRSLEQYIEQNDSFDLDQAARDSISELSLYDNHPGDIGTETFERGKDYALQERREYQLEQVSLALDSMETGTYGSCVLCGTPIPFDRLEAIPFTPYCKTHADQETSLRRPVEEEFLQPPFGRTSMDGADQTGFDGEDAWQIVSSWGNSNSPALAEDRQIEDYDDVYIEEDEREGYVEPIESFLATDLYGDDVSIVRNKAYRQYMDNKEGDRELEVLPAEDEEEPLQP